uniref:Uncharacterized protein n=1 Tax=Periophthalmus magnuspinnatus TaxID=409849 RepID=A0A3B4A6Z5_9GOBI
MYYVFMQMLSSGPAWLSIILLITVSLLPDVIKKVLCRAVCPTATEHSRNVKIDLFGRKSILFLPLSPIGNCIENVKKVAHCSHSDPSLAQGHAALTVLKSVTSN